VLLTAAVARGVADGTVDLAFRRWAVPRVREGTTFLGPAGLVRVRSVTPVDPRAITDEDARRAGAADAREVRAALLGPPSRTTYRIVLEWAGPDPRTALGDDDTLGPEDVAAVAGRLDALDRRAPHGPWTHAVLELLAARPGQRAADLAAAQGREAAAFKRDVRKLKELGLTRSLEVGYRLSPRGAAYLAARRDAAD
jgi:hypothetical protein